MPHPHFLQSRTDEEIDDPRGLLLDRVAAVLDGSTNGARRSVRVGVPIKDSVDPIHWLRAQEAGETVYWSPRTRDAILSRGGDSRPASEDGTEGRGPTFAAIGQADVLRSSENPVDFEDLRRKFRGRFESAESRIRYFGGVRFDASHLTSEYEPDEAWSGFGTYRFVLPRFELIDRPDGQTLVCNLVLPRDVDDVESILSQIESLSFPAPGLETSLPRPTRRTDRPEEGEWTRMVQWALDAIADGRLEKVVFARRVALGLDRPADPLHVLHHLKQTTPGCFHFALRPQGAPTFIGASPERLFRRRSDRVESEAVAGTRRRGETAGVDEALRQELLTSEKELREHAFVQKAIQTDLESLCTDVESSETPSELVLERGRHLHARITGTLRSGRSTIDLLEALHPTPAVGGVPSDAALSAIRRQEPFDRGWYAGPVGWIGPDAADFAVAIRSGLLKRKQLALFSGAGLVEGSVPSREWDEIEQKIGDFAAVLGLLDRIDETRL